MKYTDTEIRDLYNSYDEVLDRIWVLNTIIRSPESTFGQVNMAKAERERLIPRKRELEKQVNLVEKLFRLQFTSQAYVQEILTGSPKIFAKIAGPFMETIIFLGGHAMNNRDVLDRSLGHLTYAEQKDIVMKLAKLECDERFLKGVLNKHMNGAKRDGTIPKHFNMKDYTAWLLKEY